MATPATTKTERPAVARPSTVRAALFGGLSLTAFADPLVRLATLAWRDERYSYILLVPFLSALLLYWRKELIMTESRLEPVSGAPLVILGFALRYATDNLTVLTMGLVMVWMGAFLLCYGLPAFRAAAFPLAFLFLMIPLPEIAMEQAVVGLQKGSVSASYALFRLFGMPVTRDGFMLSLPGVEIEIAKQCSSIRSSISLFLTGLLAGHIFLRSPSRKLLLAVLTVPIAIFKNAVRIVALSCLGVYVNSGFFHGSLHHYSGLVFSVVGLALLGVLLYLLRPAREKVWLR